MSEKPVHQTPSRIALCIVATMATLGAPQTHAEIWRCGNSYSDRPCGGGRPVEADDARSPAQQRDALRGARDNAIAARELEHQRLRAQAAQPGAVLIVEPKSPPAKPRPSSKKPKRAESDRFVARDPLAPAKKKKGKSASSAAASAAP